MPALRVRGWVRRGGHPGIVVLRGITKGELRRRDGRERCKEKERGRERGVVG